MIQFNDFKLIIEEECLIENMQEINNSSPSPHTGEGTGEAGAAGTTPSPRTGSVFKRPEMADKRSR